MRRRRPILVLVTGLALVAAACGSSEPAPEASSTVATAPSAVQSSGDPELEAMLATLPDFGGSWTVAADSGGGIDVLDLVCGAAMPDDRPLSERHSGRLFLGGEPYPLLLQAIDGFASAEDAAAVVEMHRAAAESCTSWVEGEGDAAVEFTVRLLDLDVPDGGLAFEVASALPEVSVSQLAMFTDGAEIWFLGSITGEAPDDALLEQFLAQVLAER